MKKSTYVVENDWVDILQNYDSGKEGRLLRLVDLENIHTLAKHYYFTDWISSSDCFIAEDNYVVWPEKVTIRKQRIAKSISRKLRTIPSE